MWFQLGARTHVDTHVFMRETKTLHNYVKQKTLHNYVTNSKMMAGHKAEATERFL